jgi:GNAT superfamily N-acetyltransferase
MLIRPIQTLEEVSKAHELELMCYSSDTAASLTAFHLRKQLFADYFLLALNNADIVGIANGIRTNQIELSDDAMKQAGEFDIKGRHLCILTVAVNPLFRGQNIGYELMSRIIQQASHDELETIALMCEHHLIPFYEKLGFRYMKPSNSSHGGIAWHEMMLNHPN